MKNLLLLFVFCSLAPGVFSQVLTNKTDARGMKQGKWSARYPGGTLKYEGSFVNDKPVGEWKRYHENGKVKAQMSYRPSSERAFAILFDEDGKLYAKGVFEGTLRDSTWNFFSGTQLVQTENYKSGKKEGPALGFDQNGKVIWGKEWKDDLLEGRSLDYYPNGTLRSDITFFKGVKNGPALFFSEDGIKSMEGNYLDDFSDGEWNVFDKAGKIKYKIKYNKGEVLNSGALDTLQIKEFKQYDKAKGKIPEPKINESLTPQ